MSSRGSAVWQTLSVSGIWRRCKAACLPNVAELCYEDSLDGAPMVAGYRFGLVQEQEAQQ